MVGVNMVLAEFIEFKHGLHKSCGIECFEGVMLEPCLLQPCVHVAGLDSIRPARPKEEPTSTRSSSYRTSKLVKSYQSSSVITQGVSRETFRLV